MASAEAKPHAAAMRATDWSLARFCMIRCVSEAKRSGSSAGIAAATMLAACSLFQPPADLDLRLTGPSQQGMDTVSVRPLVESPAHAWEIAIAARDGNRVAFARIMRQHYRGDYEALFKAMPSLDGLPGNANRLPGAA